ncbi:MAG: translation initiation factor IF-2 [Pyrinomonadaceae bacterium]|nr:translation initiation factor IF-2 [Pyrinomonadaceae bacterium]
MTAHTSKVRLYDLAKELKLDTKRLIEEVRREGVDVSVPSNSISKELADKIRNKYFPKKETAAPRKIVVVKHAVRPAAPVAPQAEESDAPAAAATEAPAAPAAATTTTAPAPAQPVEATAEAVAEPSADAGGQAASKPIASRILLKKKPQPAQRAEPPAQASETTTVVESSVQAEQAQANGEGQALPAEPAIMEPPVTTPTVADAGGATQAAAPAQASSPSTAQAPAAAPSRQVRVLRPTAAALSAGIRHGERAPAPAPPPPPAKPQPSPSRERRDRRDRNSGRSAREPETFEYSGTPGETATPQTLYTPPPDARRRGRSRHSGRPVPGSSTGPRKPEGKGGRFDNDFLPPPRALSLEDRIAGRLETGGTTVSTGELKSVRLVEGSTVKEFAEKLGIKPKDIVTLLIQRGVFATINQPLNDDVAVDLARRFGYEITFVPFEEMVAEEEFEELIASDADDVELPRAPVVTVMGHVDHGKTSLLDGIRSTDVAAGEAGGITQHIGAYSVTVPNPDNPTEMRRVVFLDTPGHEAFTMMRARGAKATDVVVLVVAADDGVMPQTIEAIEHARAANVPIVVAINKIDKPDANPERVKQELAGHGLTPVEWGGETEMVAVSAKQHKNLDTLLETILLSADILELKASPTRLASGVVLEAKLDRGRGSVATVLVQQGTLRIGDPFIVGQIFGKVRAMFDDRGQPVTEAGPATPVEVLGLQGVPQAGETFQVVADITKAQQISHHRQMISRQQTLAQSTKRGIEALGQTEVKELLVVIKADVQGSVEVLKSTLQKLSTETVKVKVIRSGVGAITESDVLLASATQAENTNKAVVIIGFNVRPESRAADLAKQETVDIRLHSIIYKVEEEIRAAMIGMLEAVEKERILGKADVREVFRVPRVGAVAGCMVVDGTIRRNARARLIRDGVVSWEGGIASLRRFKEDVGEVREGFECGIGLENFNDIKVGDQIEAFIIEKVAATEL